MKQTILRKAILLALIAAVLFVGYFTISYAKAHHIGVIGWLLAVVYTVLCGFSIWEVYETWKTKE